MGFGEFFFIVLEDPIPYIAYLLLFESIIFFVLRKQLISIVDPLAEVAFFLGIYCATVLYMDVNNLLDEISVYHYWFSTCALILGMCLWRRGHRIHFEEPNYSSVEKYLYQLSAVIFVVTKIYLLVTFGSPLLADESRIGFYQQAGVIKTLSVTMQSFLYFLFLERCLRYKQIYFIDKAIILFLFIDLFLSGSKSAFATLLFSLNIYIAYFTSRKYISSKYVVILLPIFVFIVWAKSNYDIEIFLMNFLYSIMGRADVYVNFYGAGYDNILNYFSNDEGVDKLCLNVFQVLLNRFGIISYDDALLKYTWADKISIYINGITFQGGVNNVYNLFSLTYLGFWGSIIYSFLIGVLVSFIRNKLYLVFNMKYVMVRFFIYDVIVNAGQLVIMVHGFVAAIITDFLILCFLYMVIYHIVYSSKTIIGKGDT